MIQQGIGHKLQNILWVKGKAENIPLNSNSFDLVWMSQVFHHLEDRSQALREIHRVLKAGRYLVIRNGTQENDTETEWAKCFPEAQQFDQGRIPFRTDITTSICQYGFILGDMRIVQQLFASSWMEYYEKIRQRGLSSLIAISDQAFTSGLERLHELVLSKPQHQPVYEPIDLFVFRK